jgi:hypothetical protein
MTEMSYSQNLCYWGGMDPGTGNACHKTGARRNQREDDLTSMKFIYFYKLVSCLAILQSKAFASNDFSKLSYSIQNECSLVGLETL